MKIYTIIAHRWGDNHNHSYLVGNYSTKEQANLVALAEKHWRAGKYECEVSEVTLDYVDQDVIDAYLEDTGEDE